MSWKEILKFIPNKKEPHGWYRRVLEVEAVNLLWKIFDDPEAWITWGDIEQEINVGMGGNSPLTLINEDDENYEIMYEVENRDYRLGSINKDSGLHISDSDWMSGAMPELLEDLEAIEKTL